MKTVSRSWKIAAITLAIVMIPVVALAAVGSFTSSTTTPAVTAKNTSATAGAKAIYGLESSTASGIRTGIVGQALGTGGVGVTGTGARYGLFSNGPIGVASGKNLVCSRCVTPADTAATPAVRVYNTADQSVPTVPSLKVLTFNTEVFDNAALHSTSTNTSRLRAPIAGIYQVSAGVRDSTGTGERAVEIWRNGLLYTYVSRTATSFFGTETNISTLLNLAAGDYVEVAMEQNTGGTISANGGSPYTWFAMNWVSP